MVSVPAALLPSFSAVPLPTTVPVQLRPLSWYFASNVTESPTVFPVASAVTGDGEVKSNLAVKAPFACRRGFRRAGVGGFVHHELDLVVALEFGGDNPGGGGRGGDNRCPGDETDET